MRGIAGWLLVLAAAVAAEDEEVRWETTDDGRVRVPLPAEWRAEAIGLRAESGLLAFEFRLPGSEARCRLELWDMAGGSRDPRAYAFSDRWRWRQSGDAEAQDVVTEPWPHLVTRRDGFRYVSAYRCDQGHALSLTWHGPEGLWPQARDGFLRAISTIDSRLPMWPPAPPGFERVEKGDYLYLLHPDVAPEAVADLHRVVEEQDRAHRARHGPPPARGVYQIVVHPSKTAARALSEAAGDAQDGHHLDTREARLYAVPLALQSATEQASFAAEAYKLMHLRRYGTYDPWWLFVGDGCAAWCEHCTGEAPPAVPSRVFYRFPRELELFSSIAKGVEREDWSEQVFAYAVFFRAGPEPYRKAFGAFLRDFQETGDWEGAQETHLLSLGQEQLRAAARAFYEKELRGVPSR